MLSPEQYTAAMAKLYADQGYLRKAAEIYRYLIDRNSERTELRNALADIEGRLALQACPTRKDTELLLREWKHMLKHARRIERKQPEKEENR